MIWLVGNKGMLGAEVERLLKESSLAFSATDIEVDICNPKALASFANGRPIKWIINCAAYTAVDKAEDEEILANKVNGEGPFNFARLAVSVGARLIHISTDYVFDGMKNGPYCEEDVPNPINAYGRSKLCGEQSVREVLHEYFIVRTAWLYGASGGNFVHTMLGFFNEKDEVKVVSDQFGSPTYAVHLAKVLLKIITDDSTRFGIYNFTNEGKISWYDFAVEIYRQVASLGLVNRTIKIIPILTDDYKTKAVRPRNSCLSNEKIKKELGIECAEWREALSEFLEGELERRFYEEA